MRPIAKVRIPRVITLESGVKSFWTEVDDIRKIFFAQKPCEKFALNASVRKKSYLVMGCIIPEASTAFFTIGSGTNFPSAVLPRWTDREEEIVRAAAEYLYRKYLITDCYAIHWYNSMNRKKMCALDRFATLALEGLQRTPCASIPEASLTDNGVTVVFKSAIVEDFSRLYK